MVMDMIKKLTEKLIGTTRVSYEADSEENVEEYIEVNPKKDRSSSNKMLKYFIINDYGDIKNILDYIREGNIIILANIKTLKNKDITELKRAITKIKRTCEAVGGDVIGIDENFIIIHPNDVIVSKEDLE